MTQAQVASSRIVSKSAEMFSKRPWPYGWEASASEWDEALATALRSSYVVQERVDLKRETFPELSPDLRLRDLVVDLDPFVFQGEVEGFLTRLSGTSLANVTSGGGQVPAFLIEPV